MLSKLVHGESSSSLSQTESTEIEELLIQMSTGGVIRGLTNVDGLDFLVEITTGKTGVYILFNCGDRTVPMTAADVVGVMFTGNWSCGDRDVTVTAVVDVVDGSWTTGSDRLGSGGDEGAASVCT